MATIDVLKLVFDSDASGMKKGTEEARQGSEKLKKSVLETDRAAQELGDSFLSTLGDAKGALAGLIGISTVTAGILNEAARVDKIGKFSETIGANIEDVDAWGRVVAKHGGSAEGFQSTLKGLTDSLTELSLTGSGPASAAMAKLGISAFDAGGRLKTAFELLPEIADSFENLSKAEQVNFGQALGLDQATILTLQQGRAEVNVMIRRQKELGVATKEDTEIANEFNKAWMDTSQVFGSVFREINSVVLPVLSDMLFSVQDFVLFLKDNESFVEGIFGGLAIVLSSRLLPVLKSVLLNPATWIAALILAFASLYDDIQNFLDGNDSLIGRISEKYPIVGKIVRNLEKDFKEFFRTLKDFSLNEVIDSAISAVIADFEKFKNEVKALKEYFRFSDDGKPTQIESVGGDTSQTNLPSIKRAPDTSDLPRQFPSNVLDSINTNPLLSSPQITNNATRNNTNNNSVAVGSVNVNASGNANSGEIARNAGEALQKALQHTNSAVDDGLIA